MIVYRIYINVFFFVLAVTIAPFVGDGGKNYLLLGVIAFSPLFFIVHRVKFDRVVYAFLFFILCISLSVLVNFSHFRANTFFYTIFFVLSFLLLRDGILKGFFSIESLIKKIRILIYAYLITLVVQQFCVLLHLPVINQIFCFDDPWKLPSLALEPSHLPRFLFFLMYAYLSLKSLLLGRPYKLSDMKKDRFIWFAYFWSMLTCGSVTALLFVLLIFLTGRKITVKNVLGMVFCGCFALLLIVELTNSVLLNRTILFLHAFFTFSIEEIVYVDESAAYRVLPFFAFANTINLWDVHSWLGYGIDTGRAICNSYMYSISGDVNYMNGVNIGGMAAFVIDYGLIFIVSLSRAIFETIKYCKDKMILVVWIISSLVESINMQMFWFSLTLLVCVSYYTKMIAISVKQGRILK